VHQFALLAEAATMVRRLRARSLRREPRTQPWQVGVLDEWREKLPRLEFAQHVGLARASSGKVPANPRGCFMSPEQVRGWPLPGMTDHVAPLWPHES